MTKKEFKKVFCISVILYHAAIVSQFPALPVFTSFTPDFKTACDQASVSHDQDHENNLTYNDAIWNQCHAGCDSYYFDKELWDETTTTEFGLVCDNEWERDIPNYALYTGKLKG